MSYDGKILRRARERFEADRETRRAREEARREEVCRRMPRLREIETRLRSTTGKIIAQAMRRGTDPRPALERLRAENLGLQEERKTLLRQMGLPETYLERVPACSLCNDSGYTTDGRMCRCLREYCNREQKQELSRMLDLGNQSFETFSLDWYPDFYNPSLGMSPHAHMKRVYQTCKDFAAHFGEKGGSLLLFGPPGLGKTFLSASIAREVSAAGFSVVYHTAESVFDQLEKERFLEDSNNMEVNSRILGCDLLILDDLGTEMITNFVQSTLYRIINTRLIEQRSTILNTNIGIQSIAKRYSPQIASRLEGEYRCLAFVGEDIRQQKKRRREIDGGQRF